MRRRDLLLTSALLQPGRRLRAAFLGASHSHAFDKVRLVASSTDYDLAGIWEPGAKVRENLAQLKPQWLDKNAILGDRSIEVIFVESEVKTHGSLAIAALEAGKHVHIEKPPSDNMVDMARIADVAREKRLRIQTGYMWRYNPAVVKAIEAGRNGWLGNIYSVHARMNTLIGPDRRPEWDLFPGGQMFEQGAHLTDIVVRLLGKPFKVSTFLRHDGAFDDKLRDNTAAIFEYARGMAILVSSVLQPNANAHRALEIFGSNGSAVIRPIEPPSLEIDLAKAAGPYAAGKQKVQLPPYERYVGDIAAFARVIRGEEAPVVSLDQEKDIQETLLRASGMLN